ncbi:hypothetical protein FHS95_000793 [Sphingomonas naasensis]|uniref:DUF1178 family protein n=1 Tax=Sphingomonas naasensis TaxID=1344951 RepID=A0A4S1WV94_9SPHN|nr:DUF1178 family protein [Sphingomonas naasensis]NIJ19124.1 hypothetical protein [Sphingomonas naasensis]TGX46317.1 DUF1178 family protein [Sphingomonas naasensis]
MIVFDLKCAAGHVFEAWFGSSAAWDAQRAAGLIACPICGDGDVAKAVMAPNVAAKGNRRTTAPAPVLPRETPPPEVVKAAMEMIAAAQTKMLETSQWVGAAFTEKARAMHLGEAPAAPIHGRATAEQAQELIEEGVAVAPLLVPVVPPEQRN